MVMVNDLYEFQVV
jgi:hypothetical protein